MGLPTKAIRSKAGKGGNDGDNEEGDEEGDEDGDKDGVDVGVVEIIKPGRLQRLCAQLLYAAMRSVLRQFLPPSRLRPMERVRPPERTCQA